jgi:ABC-type lipoprotein export system ATPase subunit
LLNADPTSGVGFATADRIGRRFLAPDGAEVQALVDVSASFDAGSVTAVAGRSGSGKSTLLHMFAAIDRPDHGEAFVNGVAMSRLSRRQRRRWRRVRLGIVLPQPSDNLSERFDAAGNLRWAHQLRGSEVDHDQIDATLQRLGLGGEDRSEVRALSMGQQMRLSFACAAAGGPSLVIADEPTASLDAESASALISVLHEVAGRGAAVLVATHDPSLIEAADAVVRLEEGRRIA